MSSYILIAGSRTFRDPERLAQILAENVKDGDVIVEGGAPGVDSMAREWAEAHGVEFIEIRADWKRYGRAAGPKRNDAMTAMIAEQHGRALYIWDGKSKGTKQCIESAMRRGIDTLVFYERGVEA